MGGAAGLASVCRLSRTGAPPAQPKIRTSQGAATLNFPTLLCKVADFAPGVSTVPAFALISNSNLGLGSWLPESTHSTTRAARIVQIQFHYQLDTRTRRSDATSLARKDGSLSKPLAGGTVCHESARSSLGSLRWPSLTHDRTESNGAVTIPSGFTRSPPAQRRAFWISRTGSAVSLAKKRLSGKGDCLSSRLRFLMVSRTRCVHRPPCLLVYALQWCASPC